MPRLRTSLFDWALPPGIIDVYRRKGVISLFPWQAGALEAGEDGANLVYCAPTSGGKSLVAEVLLARALLQHTSRATGALHSGRALVILPYISIINEKTSHLTDVLRPIGATVRGYAGGSEELGQPLGPGRERVAVCTLEKGNVAVNRLQQEGRLSEIVCVVVDELHMVADSARGVALEMLLTKLLMHHTISTVSGGAAKLQIIGMSATMGGLETLQEWLNARLFVTDFRPVPLAEHVVFGGQVFRPAVPRIFHDIIDSTADDASPLIPDRVLPSSSDSVRDTDRVVPLVAEVVSTPGHCCLVFCGTRSGCEATARLLAQMLPTSLLQPSSCDTAVDNQGDGVDSNVERREALIAEIEQGLGAPLESELRECIMTGVAWHHAGLSSEERMGIEQGFKSGCLHTLTATSTLAAGVNLPARRVILKGLVIGPGGPLERSQYLQMVGRAGRAGQSDVGESYLLGKGDPGSTEWDAVCHLLASPMPRLVSQLVPVLSSQQLESSSYKLSSSHLERLLLESIASGAVMCSQDVNRLLKCTFAARQYPWSDLCAATKAALRSLTRERGLIEPHGPDASLWRATARGCAVYDSSLPLEMGLLLYKNLQAAEAGVALHGPLHFIYFALCVVPHGATICHWPQWLAVLEAASAEQRAVATLAGVTVDYARTMRSGGRADPAISERHARFAAALAIEDAVVGVSDVGGGVDRAARRWGSAGFLAPRGFSRGHLQRLLSDVSRIMAMAGLMCESGGWWPLGTLFSNWAASLSSGVRRELLPLMQVEGMTALRARALWKAKIETPAILAATPESVVTKALSSGQFGGDILRMKKRGRSPRDQRGKLEAPSDMNGPKKQLEFASSTRTATAVAGRAARALIAAAKQQIAAI